MSRLTSKIIPSSQSFGCFAEERIGTLIHVEAAYKGAGVSGLCCRRCKKRSSWSPKPFTFGKLRLPDFV